jgi:hypothetical protein
MKMSLVTIALRRPISLLMALLAVALAGVLALNRMPRDIFPDLGVPSNYYEHHFLYINGIEHVESKSIQGVGLIKLQFHPGTNIAESRLLCDNAQDLLAFRIDQHDLALHPPNFEPPRLRHQLCNGVWHRHERDQRRHSRPDGGAKPRPRESSRRRGRPR